MKKSEEKAISKALENVVNILKNKSKSFKESLLEKLSGDDYVVPDGYCGIHSLKIREKLTQKLKEEFIS